MVLSGILMLGQGSRGLAVEKQIHIASRLQSGNLETKIQWLNASYAMEFNFDEGFEFEQVIPLSSLSAVNQKMIQAGNPNGYRVINEAVYTFRHKSYEAYFFNGEELVEKFDFEV